MESSHQMEQLFLGFDIILIENAIKGEKSMPSRVCPGKEWAMRRTAIAGPCDAAQAGQPLDAFARRRALS